jgi:competence protein ComEC
MAAAALAGASGGRPGSGAVALSHAALALLIIDPAIAYDAGFRLSALATAGLLAKSKEWSARALNAGSRLPLQLRAPWLAIAEEVAVALAAQAATLGLVIASFGRVAIWSIPLTLTISPLVAPATGAAVIAIAAGEIARLTPALNAIAMIAAAPAAALFGAAAWIATAGSTLPLGGVTVAREATASAGNSSGARLHAGLQRGEIP